MTEEKLHETRKREERSESDPSLAAPSGNIPDLTKTPGVVRPGLTKSKICATKWAKDERHVTAAMKKQVFESYGSTGNDDPAQKSVTWKTEGPYSTRVSKAFSSSELPTAE